MTATTTVDLMRAVERVRAARNVAKADLARMSHLRPENVRRLLTDTRANPTLDNVLDMLRPLGLGLKLAKLPKQQRWPRPSREDVIAWLSHYGAPLYGSSTVAADTVPAPEVALAEGLNLARENATVARALPLAFWRMRGRLDMESLRNEAEQRHQDRALAFFLDLTAQLSGERTFASGAERVRCTLPAKPTQFFHPTTMRERELAKLRTPAVAKKWRFLMNMPMDSFTSMFTKAAT